ncbi:hypothetical protein MMC24_005938 [Lignoscripta atroalba]|nr:hypothetical protein [Lignoscripta atroalba]
MLALTLTADLTGVTDLRPIDTPEDPYFYTFKVQCTSCREIHPNWVNVSRFVSFANISYWKPGSRPLIEGNRNPTKYLVAEAKPVLYGSVNPRESSATIKAPANAYTHASPPRRQKVVEFDCRGLEFTEFKADGEWTAKGLESPTVFSGIDLQEGEWFDYDEKAGEEVSIKDLAWEIRRA